MNNFIVHNFSSETCSSSSILDLGRDLIHQAFTSDRWITAQCHFDALNFTTVRGHTYLFSQSPPLITHRQRHATPGLPVPQCKEWGAPFDGDEDMTLLNALEGFQSTDFSYLSAYHVSARLGEVRRRKSRSPMFEALPPAKRRLLDNSPLDNVIPEPHLYLAPSSSLSSSRSESRFQPYTKAIPRPISPYNNPSMIQEYLETPYARCAWIVPVRGVLPWAGCSSAVVLSPTNISNLPQVVNDNGQITWTHESLVAFWSFLLALRDAKNLGALSISFNASDTDSVEKEDYIKVYHDARFAMVIRNVLDAWGYLPSEGKTIRVLKGVRLILVNDRSGGILVL